jgi:hypothetical protein
VCQPPGCAAHNGGRPFKLASRCKTSTALSRNGSACGVNVTGKARYSALILPVFILRGEGDGRPVHPYLAYGQLCVPPTGGILHVGQTAFLVKAVFWFARIKETAVYGRILKAVWEDGSCKVPSYPIFLRSVQHT